MARKDMVTFFLLFTFAAIYLVYSPEYARALTGNPGYYDLGVYAYEEGELEKAKEYFLYALEIQPHYIPTYHYLGKTFLELGNLEEADHYLSVVKKMEPETPGLDLDIAKLKMEQKDFAGAFTLYKKHLNKEPDDPIALYGAGLSLLRQKQFKHALDYFSRLGKASPSAKASSDFYSGICLYNLGKLDAALEKFTIAKTFAGTDLLVSQAEKWISTIEAEKRSMKSYMLYGKIGFQYDDNVNLANDSLDTDLISEEGDAVLVGYLSTSYNFLNKKEIKAGMGYSHYQTRHSDLKEYDLIASLPDFFIKLRRGVYGLTFSYCPSYYWIDNDSYLMRHEIGPDFTWQITETTLASAGYHFWRNNFFTDGGRDGKTHVLTCDVSHRLAKGRLWFTYGLEYRLNHANRDDEDYDEIQASTALFYKLTQKVSLRFSAAYAQKSYDHPDHVFNIVRDDNRVDARATISRQLSGEQLGIDLSIDYTNNDSNITFFDYQRTAVTISLTANL